LEVPVNKAYKELNLAYNTTHKIYNRIRQCIFKFVSEDVTVETRLMEAIKKVKRGALYTRISSRLMMVW